MRYFDFADTQLVRAILTFDGPTWENESEITRGPSIVVARRGQSHVAWHLAWQREFPDAPTPSGAWNGFRLVCIAGPQVVAGIGSDVVAFNAESGEGLWTARAGNTVVHYLLPLPPPTSALVVESGYYGFEHPGGLSNLACLDHQGREVWRVRLPSDDVFSGPPTLVDGRLSAGTWGGFDYTIDRETGRIIDSVFTK